MSEDDDYLSDKFLTAPTQDSTTPRTYSQLRKDALQKSQFKNAQNRTKGRMQRELESREEGLNKSLIEKAQAEEREGLGAGNKALSMMMKMGFTPGQSLGRQQQQEETAKDLVNPAAITLNSTVVDSRPPSPSPSPSPSPPQHKIEPLPINEWTGRKGIGAIKRARSPSTNERITKMAKMEEESKNHQSFRGRARQEYEGRKAEGRLDPAQRTCATLDEKAGKALNVLWLNPNKLGSFPNGLMEALALHHGQNVQATSSVGETVQDRLKRQMQADALSTFSGRDQTSDDEDLITTKTKGADKEKAELVELNQEYDPDFLEEAVQFLRLQPQDKLRVVLSYLRSQYAYCFYCGTEYPNQEEMRLQCPGPEEDDHD